MISRRASVLLALIGLCASFPAAAESRGILRERIAGPSEVEANRYYGTDSFEGPARIHFESADGRAYWRRRYPAPVTACAAALRSLEAGPIEGMAEIEYLDPSQREYYLASHEELLPDQVSFLQKSSWMTAAEIRERFREPRPELITAIRLPEGEHREPGPLTREEVLRRLEAPEPAPDEGAPQALFQVTRATLRMVSGQTPRERRLELPWQKEPYFAARAEAYAVDRDRHPAVFEFGRAFQVQSREIDSLFSISVLLAYREASLLGMPPDSALIFVHSLDRQHTQLYRSARYGFRDWVAGQPEDNAILVISVADALRAQPPSRFLGELQALKSRYPRSLFDEARLLDTLHGIQRRAREVTHPHEAITYPPEPWNWDAAELEAFLREQNEEIYNSRPDLILAQMGRKRIGSGWFSITQEFHPQPAPPPEDPLDLAWRTILDFRPDNMADELWILGGRRYAPPPYFMPYSFR